MSTPGIASEQDAERQSHSMMTQAHQRSRAQLSCNSCRHAKLKCDRGQPCSQCTRRERPSLCTYTTTPPRRKPTRSMQSRLHHLESLVKDMMKDQTSRKGSSSSKSEPLSSPEQFLTRGAQNIDVEESDKRSKASQAEPGEQQKIQQAGTASGQVILGVKETTYVGATHWAAILDDIEVVKDYFNDTADDDLDASNELQATAMALGVNTTSTKEDLLAALPERSIVDRLVSRYFNSNDPAIYIIHKPTFQKDYHDFWEDPSRKPATWLGLLFSILCLATFYSLRAGDEPLESQGTGLEMVCKYRTLCAQSLVLADYTKPGLYTLETLLLYGESEFIQSGDGAAKCWVLFGLAVRIALRMGCHRDAKHHRNISAFQGEMRRRMWHLVAQVDLLLSFQVGLPSMIQAVQSDTAPPRNLFDEDFSEASAELPPSRPETEHTPMSYMICKSRICYAFGMVAEQANLISHPSYDKVLELDSRLREAYSSIPPFLLVRPLDQSITDSPNVIMQRFNIILLFHKSRCVLHRKYLTKEDPQSQYVNSKTSCIDSAMELLHYQSVIHDAVQPGGPLSRDRWFLATLAAHDFLLAAMIIYLSLVYGFEAKSAAGEHASGMDLEIKKQQYMFQQLEASYEIWTKAPKEFREARKASSVLAIMLKNTKRGVFSNSNKADTSPVQSAYTSEGFQFPAAYSHTIPGFEPDNHISHAPREPLEDLGTMIDMPGTLDWETWDNYVNAPTDQNPEQFWPSNLNFDNFALPEDPNVIEQSYI